MDIDTDYLYLRFTSVRRFDWSAWDRDTYSGDPSDPCGWGATEAEAIADLMAQISDREADRILSLSDEEIVAETITAGLDPKAEADKVKAILEQAIAKHKADKALEEKCAHVWQVIPDWGGDPDVINGTFDCSFLRCILCGEEAQLGTVPEDELEEERDE